MQHVDAVNTDTADHFLACNMICISDADHVASQKMQMHDITLIHNTTTWDADHVASQKMVSGVCVDRIHMLHVYL